MPLYENQHIGQFLIALGHEIGRRRLDVKCSANLLQQTPLDAPLADVHVGSDDRFVMIEFKREAGASTEFNKESIRADVVMRVSNLKMCSTTYEYLRSLSARCHWFAEGVTSKDQPDAAFSAYLLLLEPKLTNAYGSDWVKQYDSISAFVKGLFDECDDFVGVTQSQFREYVDYLFRDSKGVAPPNKDWLILKANKDGVTWSTTTITSYISPNIKVAKPAVSVSD